MNIIPAARDGQNEKEEKPSKTYAHQNKFEQAN